MFRPRVIPCLLLHNQGLVKTQMFSSPRYIGDPMNAVKIYNDLEADELVFLDISASREGKTIDLDFVRKVGEEAYMPFAVGGGISTIEHIRSVLEEGAEKVVINTAAYDFSFIKEAVETFGGQSIIISIDVRNESGEYVLYTHGGTQRQDISLESLLTQLESIGVGEIFITSIDNEGSMEGYDISLIKRVCSCVSLPIIAHGGAGTYDDLSLAVHEGGASAVAGGSIFVYSGRSRGILITYPSEEDMKEIFK